MLVRHLTFYIKNKAVESSINNDSVTWKIPSSDSANYIRAVFISGKNKLEIDSIPAYVLMPNYRVNLIFGIDRYPFGENVELPVHHPDTIAGSICYIKIDPIEKGLGRIFRSFKN